MMRPAVEADELYKLIHDVLVEPVWSAVQPLHGCCSFLHGATADFFFFAPLLGVPGLVLSAPIAFAMQGWAAGRVVGPRLRALVVAGSSLVYVLVAAVFWYADSRIGSFALLGVPLVVLPTRAIGFFGFWLPTVACGTYTKLAKHPKWWVSGPMGTLTLILGVWLWILLGTLVGAPFK